MKQSFLLIPLLMCLTLGLSGQREGFYPALDTVPDVDPVYVPPKVKAKIFAGRPGRAALYSLILPGAGQAYNKRYWQVPIVWAGVGTAGVVLNYNVKEYRSFRGAYEERIIAQKEGREPMDEYIDRYSTGEVKTLRDEYNRFRQISIVVFSLVWIANSAHAYVDAHLREFDISDDLSLELMPMQSNEFGSYSSGIVLKF